MSLQKFLARPLISCTLKLLFPRHRFSLLGHEDYGNMGELYVYGFEGFRLHVINDRGEYYAQLTPPEPTDIWHLSLVLEYLGAAEERGAPGSSGLLPMVKELWLLSRNAGRVRELFEGEGAGRAKAGLDESEARKLERLVEGLKGGR